VELKPVEFSRHLLSRVQNFTCGKNLWAEFAADWIKQAPPFPCALRSMEERGTRVWLYLLHAALNDQVEEEYVVGFSSLGATTWTFPPDGGKREVGMIPMLAVASSFHGKPGGQGAKRYSHQILEHVIAEARKSGYRELCLKVHAENDRALKLYERFGFRNLGPKDGRGNFSMLKLLD
jgi:ribosomal protein S18 acetylase RimI-like enzyme